MSLRAKELLERGAYFVCCHHFLSSDNVRRSISSGLNRLQIYQQFPNFAKATPEPAPSSVKRKVLYRYNPETDNYERAYPTLRERVMAAVRFGGFATLIGIAIFLIFTYAFASPSETALRNENAELRARYNILQRRVDNSLKVMANIQNRDDNFYRVMMQMDPLSRGQRLAGLDNEQRYQALAALTDDQLVERLTRSIDYLDRCLYAQSTSFDQLREMATHQEDKLARTPAVLPISVQDYTMASGYGYRRDPLYGSTKFHEGLDFAAATGTNVYATADGTVVHAGWQGRYGNCVDVDHGYNYLTRYAHLSSINVKEGAAVKRGEMLGKVGSTGKSSGPHLHYEVRFKGQPQNPVNYYFMDVTPEQYNDMVRMAENAGHVMD